MYTIIGNEKAKIITSDSYSFRLMNNTEIDEYNPLLTYTLVFTLKSKKYIKKLRNESWVFYVFFITLLLQLL